MKNIKRLREIFVIVLSVCLVLACTNIAFAADDDDLFNSIDASNSTSDNNTSSDDSNDLDTNTNNTLTNNSLVSTNETNTTNNSARNATLTTNTATNTNNTTSDRNVSNTNKLADTGLSKAGDTIILVVVICGISAIYSYKKVNDYKKL